MDVVSAIYSPQKILNWFVNEAFTCKHTPTNTQNKKNEPLNLMIYRSTAPRLSSLFFFNSQLEDKPPPRSKTPFITT